MASEYVGISMHMHHPKSQIILHECPSLNEINLPLAPEDSSDGICFACCFMLNDQHSVQFTEGIQ